MDGQGLRAEPWCACLPLDRATEGQKGLGQELWMGSSTKRGYFQECQSPSFWLQTEEGQLSPRGRGNLQRVGSAESPPHPTAQPAWAGRFGAGTLHWAVLHPLRTSHCPCQAAQRQTWHWCPAGGQGAAEETPASGQWQTPPCCHAGSEL